MPNDFFNNLGSNLGTQFGEALGASLFGGSAGESNPQAIFNPWNISNMGGGTHFNPNSRTYGYNYSQPELDAYNSLFGIAQSNFNAAGSADPYQIGQEYYDRIRAMQQPSEARRLSDLRDNLFASGRLGLGMGPNGANPELAAYYQSMFEQDNALAANSLLAGQNIVDQTLARGRSGLDGAMGISGRGLDAIKLGGILGTYGTPRGTGSTVGGGLWGPGGGTPLVGNNGVTLGPGSMGGGMPIVGGPGGGGGAPFVGSGGGPVGDPTSGGGLDLSGEVGFGGGQGSAPGTDVLSSLFGLEGGTAGGNFVDGLFGPLDETANFIGDGISTVGGLFGGGSSPETVGLEGVAGAGTATTGSPMLDNSGVGTIVGEVLSGQVALNQLAAQDLTSIAQAMPAGMGQAFAAAISSGNIAQAEHILRAVINHQASSGGGAGFGWEEVGIDRGLEQAASGSAGEGGLNIGRRNPIWG